MAAAPKLPFIAPSDLDNVTIKRDGTTGKYKVIASAVSALSTDTGNLLTLGSDNGYDLTPAAVKAAQNYPSIAVDNTAHTATFHDGQGGTTVVPLGTTDIHTTGVSLVGTVLHLQNSDGSADETVDLGAFMTALSSANGNGTSVTGDGKATPFKVTVVADPVNGNLITVSAAGLRLTGGDVLAFLNANLAVSTNANILTVGTQTANIINSSSLSVDLPNGVAHMKINGVDATIGVVELTDAQGNHVGTVFA